MILVTVTEFRNNLSKYLELAFKEKVALKSKKGIIELNPSSEILLNPSPSRDPWFDNKENVKELNRRLADIDSGKSKPISWEDAKAQLGL
ncbi:MAG: addiction module protein [Rikenellaceae bacterium]